MTLSEIKSDIDFLCSTTSATYENTDKLRNINIAYLDVAQQIWEAQGSWQYDDSNATTLPIATRDLSNGQQDYELPSTCQRVERVEVMDGSGNFIVLKQKDIHDISVGQTEYFETDGTPLYYDILGRSLMLYPAPATGYVTMNEGLKVFFNRDVTPLDDDADVPGFATPFHRILSYAAALDFTRDPGEHNRFMLMKDKLEKALSTFYGKRNVEGKTRINPAGKKRWRSYT